MNNVERYFEVTYPKRVKELKEKLEPIAEEFAKKISPADDAELEKLFVEFDKIFISFVDNTKLHLISMKNTTSNTKHITMLTPIYFIEQFGGIKTPLGRLFKAAYTQVTQN